MKKFLSFLLAFCLMIPSFFMLTACDKNTGSKKFNLSGSVIKNFENYSSIGAAYVGEKTSNYSFTASVNAEKKKDENNIKLVGKEKDGEFEEIKFEKDDKSIIQTWQVCDMVSFGKFIFIKYTNEEFSKFNSWDTDNPRPLYIVNNNHNATYIIDSETGKVYSTEKIKDKIKYLNIDSQYKQIAYTTESLYIMSEAFDSENSKDIYQVFKIFIENEDLVVKKIIDNAYLDFNRYGMLVDCYENVFLKNNNDSYQYVIKNDETLKVVENLSLSQSINGVVYCENKKFNSDCELVEMGQDEEFLSSSYKLIKEKDNIKYYFSDKSLVKTVWDNDGNFSTEKFTLDRNYSDYAYTSNKIYFIESQSIFYYDLNDNTYHDLISDYIFSSIEIGYNNDILFTGINYSLQVVSGVIKDNGTIDVSVSDDKYEIIYIKSLN